MNKPMIFGIDFDGTVVTHDFPYVGSEVPNAVEVIKELVTAGHHVVLWTMRSYGPPGDDTLSPAVNWFAARGIPLYGINSNPTQRSWTGSPKAYATCYIDDAALGCPLHSGATLTARPYVDWVGVRKMLVGIGALPDKEA